MHIFHSAAQEPRKDPTRTAVLWICIYHNSLSILQQRQHDCCLSSVAVNDYFRSHLGESWRNHFFFCATRRNLKWSVECPRTCQWTAIFVRLLTIFSPRRHSNISLKEKQIWEAVTVASIYCEGKSLKKAGLKSHYRKLPSPVWPVLLPQGCNCCNLQVWYGGEPTKNTIQGCVVAEWGESINPNCWKSKK